MNVRIAAKNATTIATCVASCVTPGKSNDGVATSHTIKRERKNAPGSREITAKPSILDDPDTLPVILSHVLIPVCYTGCLIVAPIVPTFTSSGKKLFLFKESFFACVPKNPPGHAPATNQATD